MNMESTQYVPNEEENEIDLLDLLVALRRHLAIIIAAAILGGAIAALVSLYVITPQYSSHVTMFVLDKEDTASATLTELQIGSQLTNDYQVILTSRPVLESVIQTLSLDTTYNQLQNQVTVSKLTDTRMLEIAVSDEDPAMAKLIVDQIAVEAEAYIANTMEMTPPKIIGTGEISDTPDSPNKTRNTLIGAILGALLVCATVVITYLMNDTVKTEEDVAKHLGLTVLASVPMREDRTKLERKEKKEAERAKRDRRKARKKRLKKKKKAQQAARRAAAQAAAHGEAPRAVVRESSPKSEDGSGEKA